MRGKLHILNHLTSVLLMVVCCLGGTAKGQPHWYPSSWGPSDPGPTYECGDYQWPLTQSPCPEVQIKQKHDHTPFRQYQAQGWDTAVTCNTRRITLSCMPYLPTQWFNGQYTVDQIPYDPPDTTFALGTKMPVSTDDDFAEAATAIPFDFFFFGIKKTAFVLGANGLITFNTSAAGRYCPWKFSAPIPWKDNTVGAPHDLGVTGTAAFMRDAIYGIYEDTHPIASYLHGDQGIYYGIQDEEPCRKIICSWNGIPTFPGSRNLDNRCTYQIVCYEGSNIIEVHIKRRGVNSTWQNGRGLLGIQNATGMPQVRDPQVNPNLYDSALAAYYPQNFNLLNTAIDSSIAFRFTPKGTTQRVYKWYRLLTIDGADSLVELSNHNDNPDDTNGSYYPMGSTPSCPNLTRAVVQPTCNSRYVFYLKFQDASTHWYHLRDTIVIGMDTANTLILRPRYGTAADHQMNVCAGEEARMILEYPELQDTVQMTCTLTRINGGATTELPDSLLTIGQMSVNEQSRYKEYYLKLHPDSTALNVRPGEVDSINVHFFIRFASGCENSADFLLRTLPAYDTTEYYGICRGESFTWHHNGETYYTATTTPQVNIPTADNCDSVVHLNLSVSENSYYIDYVSACKPILWHGKWYYESNTATAATDIFDTVNPWGCDSTVQLVFTMTPMTPIIDASLDYFDFNHLDVVLTDVSTGGDGRTWYLPTGDPQHGVTAYYCAPNNIDSANIIMVETSPYGCIDTAYLTIPFRRDVIWAPNTFTPNIPDNGNDRFHTVSNHILKQQTLIYNRFGELVFSCNEIDCQWDGTDAGGNPCPQGAYVYVVRYTTEYDPHTTQVLKGTVTLLR